MNEQVAKFVDNLAFCYIIDSECPYLLQSGLIFTSKNPSGHSLPSTPFKMGCLAPKFYCGKYTKSQCKRVISDIGPYCREHSILYQTLDVRPSTISPEFRGLFACASKLNVAEIRHQRSSCTKSRDDTPAPLRFLTETEQLDIAQRKTPLFLVDDIIGYFGGVFGIKTSRLGQGGALDPQNPASYVLLYESDGKEIIVDGFIESSGIARFSNSIIKTKEKSIGEEHLNATMGFIRMDNMNIEIDQQKFHLLPCLVASRDIFDGDEIITDYDSDYWTKEMIQSLPVETQDYLKGKTDKKPLFFKNATAAEN